MLRLLNLQHSYGGLSVLRGVDLEIDPRAVTGIIGPNGSGKTTLLNIVTGVCRPTRGAVLLGDQRLDRLEAHRIARAGIGRTFQSPRAFASLSVLDNVAVAVRRGRELTGATGVLGQFRHRRGSVTREAGRLLAWAGLAEHHRLRPAELAYGHRKRLDVARALALAPSLLLMDEPVAGMTSEEERSMRVLLAELVREHSVGLVIVDHNFDFIRAVCARTVVLHQGTVIADGAPDHVMRDPTVVDVYLGR